MIDHRDPTQAGFTLVEVLVALAVLGVVLAGVAQGVRFGLSAWDRQSAMLSAYAELDAVDRTLRALLAQAGASRGGGATGAASPRRGNAPRGSAAPAAAAKPAIGDDMSSRFVGAADSMSFDAVLPRAVADIGRRAQILLALEPDRRLVMRWRSPLTSATTGQPLGGNATLLSGVSDVAFRYYGSLGQGQPAEWFERWESNTPPQLIRVHFVFPKGDRRNWPDLVVASVAETGAQ
jgi:general secretion pathway protein J